MNNNLFNILSHQGHIESAKNFDMNSLMGAVKLYETETHLYIDNFPGAFGDVQNKNNRVYDQDSLVYAVEQFNDIKKENPYFCYMFDGHKDDDSYEHIVGSVTKLHLDESIKCVLIDMKINKGCNSWDTIKNIMQDGDPLGASMRILSPNTINVSKEDLKGINPDVVFLDDDNVNLAYLMSKDNSIEYITGDSFIQRFDITQFPSFNNAFVAKPFDFKPEFNKNESATFKLPNIDTVKLADYREASTLFTTTDKCITNACKFRHTIKDFVELLNRDESIKNIKDNPELYDDMLKFSYLNLSSFDFTKIKSPEYLSEYLTENKIKDEDLKQQNETINKIVSQNNNIIDYIMNCNEFNAMKLNKLLNTSLMGLADEDNIFYQVITVNYLHYTILASILLTGKAGATVNNKNKVYDKLESALNESTNNEFIIDLMKNIDENNNTNIYDYINLVFTYIYQYVDEYSDKAAPLTIVNESMKIFQAVKQMGVVTNKYVK